MIINLIFNFFTLILGAIFLMLPVVTVADIPVIGDTIESICIFAVQHWNSLVETVPYFNIVWTITLYIVIPFEIGLLSLKFLLGNRVPTRD